MEGEEDIAVGHSFDFKVEVEGLSFDEKIELCNAFDAYEIERDVGELFIVDVISFDKDSFILRVTVKKPLTYTEIDTYLKDLLLFADEKIERPLKMEPAAIKWNVGLYGIPSTRVDIKAMTERASKMQSLKSLRVDVVQEEMKSDEQRYNLEAGAGYLVETKDPHEAYSVFHDLVTHGVPGLCICRTHPEEIKEKYGLKNTPMVWLTRKEDGVENVLQPTRLPQLALLVQRFLQDAKDSVVILEGVEYLITHNNFSVILKLLQSLNDEVMSSDSRMILPIDPDALDSRQMALLERDFRTLGI